MIRRLLRRWRRAKLSRLAWDGYIDSTDLRDTLFWLGEIRRLGL